MPIAGLHPFQRFELESLPAWRGLPFNDQPAGPDEDAVNDMESAFQTALRERHLPPFIAAYVASARAILGRSGAQPLVHDILGEALARLTFYYAFLIRRRRAALATPDSSLRWVLDAGLLRHARRVADELERAGRRTSDYYTLADDPPLAAWVGHHVRPVIEDYVGSRAVAPHAHIRVVSTERFAHTWQHLYRQHAYGYFHWDELCYSIPLIVYLDDVGEADGPYSYVDGSDKWPQNLTVRAFMQAISCRLLPAAEIDDAHRRRVAALPRIFRGGERVGSHLDERAFAAAQVTRVTGVAGTAVLSDGFSLVHGGGHPSGGRRRALFIAHRYPRKRLLDVYAGVARRWWRLRVPRQRPTAAVPAPRSSGA
jgi:hypothetical protein